MSLDVFVTGTGIPIADANRAGAGVLVRRDDLHLQFDAGRATVMRLAAIDVRAGMLDAVFVTHHHSDHLQSLDDLAMTRWIERSDVPLPVVAPEGPATRFAARCLDAWDDDFEARAHHMGRDTKPRIDVTGFAASDNPSIVWQRDAVSVSAVAVRHQPLEPAVAFRVDAPEGSVVVSGDTRVCDEVERLATGVDVLVHEVALVHSLDGTPWEVLFEYHADSLALGAMAERAGVRTLVLTHFAPPPGLIADVDRYVADVREGGYSGAVVAAADLERITVA